MCGSLSSPATSVALGAPAVPHPVPHSLDGSPLPSPSLWRSNRSHPAAVSVRAYTYVAEHYRWVAGTAHGTALVQRVLSGAKSVSTGWAAGPEGDNKMLETVAVLLILVTLSAIVLRWRGSGPRQALRVQRCVESWSRAYVGGRARLRQSAAGPWQAARRVQETKGRCASWASAMTFSPSWTPSTTGRRLRSSRPTRR